MKHTEVWYCPELNLIALVDDYKNFYFESGFLTDEDWDCLLHKEFVYIGELYGE